MWTFAVWGLVGGLAFEGAEIIQAKQDQVLPWARYGRGVYAIRIIIRMGLGGCVAAALGCSGQITNALMALMSGASAPLLLEKASQITQGALPGRANTEPSQSDSPTIRPQKILASSQPPEEETQNAT